MIGADAVLRIAADRLLEIAQHVLPDQLRIAAVAIIARRGEFLVEQFGQFQQRRGGELAVGIRLVLGRGDERRQQIVFAEPQHSAAAVGAKLRVGGQHGVAQRACQAAMLFVDDRFPALVDLVQAANDFPAAGVAVPIQKSPQRSFLNLDARESRAGMRMPTAASFLVCVSRIAAWFRGLGSRNVARGHRDGITFVGRCSARSAGESRTGAAFARIKCGLLARKGKLCQTRQIGRLSATARCRMLRWFLIFRS